MGLDLKFTIFKIFICLLDTYCITVHRGKKKKKKKKKRKKERKKKQSLFRDVKSFIQKKCPKIYMEICGKEEFK